MTGRGVALGPYRLILQFVSASLRYLPGANHKDICEVPRWLEAEGMNGSGRHC